MEGSGIKELTEEALIGHGGEGEWHEYSRSKGQVRT